MIPFHVEFKPGAPVYEQVVYAVKKAVIAGALQPGDKFPSVRLMSQALRINPNTAHKVVAALVQEGLLEVLPGVGTVVADARPATRQQRSELLGAELERLVVEAKKLRLDRDELLRAVERHWDRLT
jgi:GntR family transcriptional regulator